MPEVKYRHNPVQKILLPKALFAISSVLTVHHKNSQKICYDCNNYLEKGVDHMDNSEKNQDELISTVPSIRIKLCGNFCINYGNKILDVKDISSQLCTLIAFLAVHQGSPCTAEMIISALFSDETRNPQSALKNQVYRCRKFLVEKNIPAAKDLILTMKGGYYLNPHLSIQIDTTEIESICKLLAASNVDLSNEEHYLQLFWRDCPPRE